MDRINSANVNVVSGKRYFQDLNLAANTRGTQVNALFLNNTQEELVSMIEASGQTPDATNTTQVKQAIMTLTSAKAYYNTTTAVATTVSTSITFTAPSNGILDIGGSAGTAGTMNANLTMTASGATLLYSRASYSSGTGGFSVADYVYTVAAGAVVTVTATQTISGSAATIYLGISGIFHPTV